MRGHAAAFVCLKFMVMRALACYGAYRQIWTALLEYGGTKLAVHTTCRCRGETGLDSRRSKYTEYLMLCYKNVRARCITGADFRVSGDFIEASSAALSLCSP